MSLVFCSLFFLICKSTSVTALHLLWQKNWWLTSKIERLFLWGVKCPSNKVFNFFIVGCSITIQQNKGAKWIFYGWYSTGRCSKISNWVSDCPSTGFTSGISYSILVNIGITSCIKDDGTPFLLLVYRRSLILLVIWIYNLT